MIIVRSPHRISLAGGGSDMHKFFSKNEFGATCSLAINRYVYVTINNLADYFPHRLRIAYSQTELTQDALHADGSTSVNPVPMSNENKQNLLDHLMLFYLGGNRSGSTILKEQNSNTVKNVESLLEMRSQAIEVAQILTGKPPFDSIGKLLKKGWDLKKSLAGSISNSEVDVAMQTALDHGAMGGKLLGAGGTGFLLCYVKPEHQEKVRSALSKYREIQFEVDPMGSTLLYYGEN